MLRANAINYAVVGQGAPALVVGNWKQTRPPKMDRDVVDLIDNRKVPVCVLAEDLRDRGIEPEELVAGVEILSRAALADLFESHEIVSIKYRRAPLPSAASNAP